MKFWSSNFKFHECADLVDEKSKIQTILVCDFWHITPYFNFTSGRHRGRTYRLTILKIVRSTQIELNYYARKTWKTFALNPWWKLKCCPLLVSLVDDFSTFQYGHLFLPSDELPEFPPWGTGACSGWHELFLDRCN